MSAITFLPKLTLTGIGCNPKLGAVAPDGAKVPLAKIYGIARGTRAKTDTKGDVFLAITGDFEAQNLASGDMYRSGILYLPGGIHELVLGAIESSVNDAGEYRPVNFGLEVYVHKAKNPIGYSYSATNLAEPGEYDPLAAMRARAMSIGYQHKPSLPAPAPEAASAPEAEPVAEEKPAKKKAA